MTERRYSLAEIDAMRVAIRTLIFGPYEVRGLPERTAREAAQIEDQLRTYMLNGTDPLELADAAMAMPCPPLQLWPGR